MQIEDCESKMQDKDIEAIHLLVQKNRKIWWFQKIIVTLDKTEHVPPLKTVKSVQFWS